MAVQKPLNDVPPWVTDRIRCCVLSDPADADTVATLEINLAVLRRSDLDLWHAGMVPAGADGRAWVWARLREADLIMIVLSPSFLAAEESAELVQAAFARQKDEGTRLFPILARNVLLAGTPFEGKVLLPKDKKPLRTRSNAEDAYVEIAIIVRETVKQLRELRPAAAAAESASPAPNAGIAPRVATPPPGPRLLDTVPYPWSTPHAQRLHELLATAYDSVASAAAIAKDAGVPVVRWDSSGAPWEAWKRLIDLAVKSGTLRALVDAVLRDAGVQGIWKPIREAIGEP
jgi:hypothetical protein